MLAYQSLHGYGIHLDTGSVSQRHGAKSLSGEGNRPVRSGISWSNSRCARGIVSGGDGR